MRLASLAARRRYYKQCGSPYKLLFGPKSFTVISSASQAKHVLATENKRYDKGVLAEILEPIMGQGLIPATPEVWSKRRKEIGESARGGEDVQRQILPKVKRC